MGRAWFAFLLAALSARAAAAAAPASIVYVTSPVFADHMVLQRGMPVPVWGVGSPVGGEITVSVAGQTKTTTVGKDGRWRVYLDALTAGGPYRLTVRGTKTIQFDDVLVGEVWLCSGQSNMSKGVAPITDRQSYPLVRTYRHHDWQDTPSEMAWWLGAYLYDDQKVPIGIINEAVSGSNIRTWLPTDSDRELPPGMAADLGPFLGINYRDLIDPLAPYAMRGVFWWQGESDAIGFRADIYGEQLNALIRSWRRHFEQNLTFIYIMLPVGRGASVERDARPLPPVPDPHDSTDDVAMFQAYLDALDLPNTGMVVTKDLGSGIHPQRRDLFAERMVLWARHLVYGENVTYAGPILDSVTREGSRVRIHYRPGTAEGMYPYAPYPLQGFTISDNGVNFIWANAEIQGNEIVVWGDYMTNPVEVRYAWAYYSRWANLANGADMAAAPFRAIVPPQ